MLLFNILLAVRSHDRSSSTVQEAKELIDLEIYCFFQYSKKKEDFSERMWRLHHKITSIALLNARPLRRWLTSIVILIPKDKGKPKIHRLRIINTYESEYNLILKYF